MKQTNYLLDAHKTKEYEEFVSFCKRANLVPIKFKKVFEKYPITYTIILGAIKLGLPVDYQKLNYIMCKYSNNTGHSVISMILNNLNSNLPVVAVYNHFIYDLYMSIPYEERVNLIINTVEPPSESSCIQDTMLFETACRLGTPYIDVCEGVNFIKSNVTNWTYKEILTCFIHNTDISVYANMGLSKLEITNILESFKPSKDDTKFSKLKSTFLWAYVPDDAYSSSVQYSDVDLGQLEYRYRSSLGL